MLRASPRRRHSGHHLRNHNHNYWTIDLLRTAIMGISRTSNASHRRLTNRHRRFLRNATQIAVLFCAFCTEPTSFRTTRSADSPVILLGQEYPRGKPIPKTTRKTSCAQMMPQQSSHQLPPCLLFCRNRRSESMNFQFHWFVASHSDSTIEQVSCSSFPLDAFSLLSTFISFSGALYRINIE